MRATRNISLSADFLAPFLRPMVRIRCVGECASRTKLANHLSTSFQQLSKGSVLNEHALRTAFCRQLCESRSKSDPRRENPSLFVVSIDARVVVKSPSAPTFPSYISHADGIKCAHRSHIYADRKACRKACEEVSIIQLDQRQSLLFKRRRVEWFDTSCF